MLFVMDLMPRPGAIMEVTELRPGSMWDAQSPLTRDLYFFSDCILSTRFLAESTGKYT